MHTIEQILVLAELYSNARALSAKTLARQATKSSTWLDRCRQGRVTFESAQSFVLWLAAHWPPGLEWPRDIERPGSGEHPEADAGTPTVGLGPDGTVASAAALCGSLGVSRNVYLGVVRRYHDGADATRWPRAGSASERVLGALIALGDARFAARRAGDEAHAEDVGARRDQAA